MEKMAVKDIGHLPCLHRHNALLDALTGNILHCSSLETLMEHNFCRKWYDYGVWRFPELPTRCWSHGNSTHDDWKAIGNTVILS